MPTLGYIPVTNTGGPISTQWLTGETRFFVYDTQDGSFSCEDAEALFQALTSSQKIARTIQTTPETSDEAVKEFVNRDCDALPVDDWPTKASINNSLYEPPESQNPDPAPTPGAKVPTATQVTEMNPDIFKAVVQWQGDKARIANGVTPPGGTIQYYFAGQPAITSLPTTYDYDPGEDVMLILAVSNSTFLYQQAWTQKSMVNIKIGPSPN